MPAKTAKTAGSVSGLMGGLTLAPWTGLLSFIRQSRMFHPTGLVCSAIAKPVATTERANEVALRLAGPLLVRWSSAWWKTGEWMDVLGCALRFSHPPLGAEPKPHDQDLLLATIQRPWTLPFAPWTTRQHDFLANNYYGVSPFEVAPLGRVEWRLSAQGAASTAEGSRAEKLTRRIEAGSARVVLEWAPYPGALTAPISEHFEPLVDIQMTGFVELDQRALSFDPFRAGRGLQPVGFVHALRRATYLSSQTLRPRGPRATVAGSQRSSSGGPSR